MLLKGIHSAKGNVEIVIRDKELSHPVIQELKNIIDTKGAKEDLESDGCSFSTDRISIRFNGKNLTLKGDQLQSFLLALLTDPKLLNIQLMKEDYFDEGENLEVEISVS